MVYAIPMNLCDSCDREVERHVFCSPKCKAYFHNHPEKREKATPSAAVAFGVLKNGATVEHAKGPMKAFKHGCKTHGKANCVICR